MAIKVKLREKYISVEKTSLYLDYYPPILNNKTGKTTRRKFLKKYLYNTIKVEEQKYLDKNGKEQKKYVPVLNKNGKHKKVVLSSLQKAHNENEMLLAEAIRGNEQNRVNKPEVYNEFEKSILSKKEKGSKSFIEYYKSLMKSRKGTNYDNWASALFYLLDFENIFVQKVNSEAKEKDKISFIRFSDLNQILCREYKEYLLNAKSKRSKNKKLSQNSVNSYFNKFKAALKQSFKDGYIDIDLNSRVESVKPEETKREVLTLEELNKLVVTDCINPALKKAALFSALTGLRFSDIQKMKWREIEFIKEQGYVYKFRQKKTESVEVLPISDQARKILGERKENNEKVFPSLKYSAHQNNILLKWMIAAGITKHITFHNFRHSYAVIQLQLGTDIYTVSKMLGHKELSTTQIYAKIVDETKRQAASRIKLDLK